MQSQSLTLLAEVLHDERQTEAARFQIANQACAHQASLIDVVASAGRRVWIALANAARLHTHGALMRGRGNSSPTISGLSADTL